MACKSFTLSGIGLGCKDHMGGIKEVYLILESDVTKIEVTEGAVSAITLAESAKFKTYKFRKGTGQMTSTATSDESVGTFSVQTDLALQFSTMDTAKRMEIMAMCLESLKGIVLDSNGKYWLLGYDYPISASAAGAASGLAYADFGGYTVTLTDNSKEFPYEIPAEVFETIKANIDAAPVA